ncbi:MAG: maltose ABC transporter permease MalF [Anaerolineae bacterium]|nr:maltose ABC transporter permease MalF [Anaerolineae bacterium]CAG0996874.1 Maltose/maltodextrin transport system permease protein MalF [Anaerolineae bacterium]
MKLSPLSLPALITRVVLLGIFDVVAIWMAVTFTQRISPLLGILIAVFAVIVNLVFLRDDLFAWRWIIPAMAGMVLLVIYPIGYSLIVAFSNYGDDHILTKEQAVAQITHNRADSFYEPQDSVTYFTYVYLRSGVTQATQEDFRFYLVDPNGKSFVSWVGLENPLTADDPQFQYGERDANGVPASINEWKLVPPQGFGQTLQGLNLSAPPYQIRLTQLQLLQRRFVSKQLAPRFAYSAENDTITDIQTGEEYRNEKGYFVFGDGDTQKRLSPGFAALIGMDKIVRVITDERIRDPFFRVFIWTIVFATGTVFTTFALGLIFALVLNAKFLPGKVIFRTLLIIPYAVPFWLSVTSWRGLLSVNGPLNDLMVQLLGRPVNPFADPTSAKVMVLLVNLYLGFPYMMLLSLGALQSIPSDMYEASMIDGANDRQQFQFITLPLLLLAIGPLLIASFAFNFNNFVLIELLNNGGPPIASDTVAGHTDILLSYTYRLAFGGGRGADYGFAAAIGIFIFLIVGTITFFNFRFTRQLEEVSKNV